MSAHLVLPRKLRPKRFAGLLGQEALANTLKHAVHSQKTAHAMLFAGSQGVGKTSAARILAKALNCEQPEAGEPCNLCSVCQEIEQGASPDVIEIDAASNRGVDNIRDIRENVRFLPVRLQYKVYIIDEAHMLTQEAFNALLKTLEEPPGRVRFVLATTDPQKMPATILSRCQRFDFLRLPLKRLVERLNEVAEQEGIHLSPKMIEMVAKHAGGGMRDALMALERAAAFADGQVDEAQMMQMLGFSSHSEAVDILHAVLQKKPAKALAQSNQALQRGTRPELLLEGLLKTVSTLAAHASLASLGEQAQPNSLDPPPPELLALAPPLNLLQQLFYLLLETEQLLKLSEHRGVCFDMCLLQACQLENLQGIPELLQAAGGLIGAAVPSPSTDATPDQDTSSAVSPDAQANKQNFRALTERAKSMGSQDSSQDPSAPAQRTPKKKPPRADSSSALASGAQVEQGRAASSTQPATRPAPSAPRGDPTLPPLEAYEDGAPSSASPPRLNASPWSVERDTPPNTPPNTQGKARPNTPPLEAYEDGAPSSASPPRLNASPSSVERDTPPNTPPNTQGKARPNAPPRIPPNTQGKAPGNSTEETPAASTGPSVPASPAAGALEAKTLGPAATSAPKDDPSAILCNDERWVALVHAVRQHKHRSLINRLNNAEVKRLSTNQGEAVYRGMPALTEAEAAVMERYTKQVFGEDFVLQLRPAQPTEEIKTQHTLAKQQAKQKQAQQQAIIKEAKKDPQVTTTQQLFPGASVQHVKLPAAGH